MADFFWCMMAAQRDWSIEETANKLKEVSVKAQERARLNDEGYAPSLRRMEPQRQSAAGRGAGEKELRHYLLFATAIALAVRDSTKFWKQSSGAGSL